MIIQGVDIYRESGESFVPVDHQYRETHDGGAVYTPHTPSISPNGVDKSSGSMTCSQNENNCGG